MILVLTISVKLQCSLDRGGLIRVGFADGNHCIQTLLCHQHPVKTHECVLKGSSKVFARLEIGLLSEFGLKILFAELCTLETAMSIKYRK